MIRFRRITNSTIPRPPRRGLQPAAPSDAQLRCPQFLFLREKELWENFMLSFGAGLVRDAGIGRPGRLTS